MRFLGSKFTQNALAADPAGGAKAITQTPCRFQGRERERRGKGRRERRKGVLGREEGREGKGKEEGKGRGGVCAHSLRHYDQAGQG